MKTAEEVILEGKGDLGHLAQIKKAQNLYKSSPRNIGVATETREGRQEEVIYSPKSRKS